MEPASGMKITVSVDGPYLVEGSVPMSRQSIVADERGNSIDWREGDRFEVEAAVSLCRCGSSTHKPYCDESHIRVGFDGTETASHGPYLAQAGEQPGPSLTLTDAEELCAFARFCDVAGQIWNLVDQEGTDAAELVVREASHCPSGRLIAWDRGSGEAMEPDLEPSIGIVHDPVQGVAGPLWVRGGVAIIGNDGDSYEVRNRVTLCRCGASRNKPFCDASHVSIKFTE
jgi:CDGSH-type Zn-finger protein